MPNPRKRQQRRSDEENGERAADPHEEDADRRKREERQHPEEGSLAQCQLWRMNPWRAAETSATASGNKTRIASRSARACASDGPSA
jgi:hypothetical protein